ncbi:MAG TPA: ArsA family ATPase, partial [Labilithrix sp.]|nr:ArsA family ATPase [Labilithrix sp.]
MARRPRFIFFGGKGGVGKTTCAAAAAVRAATEGARVLVVSTDPAHSLADALELELGAEARPVRDVAGELQAAELDADKALTRWLREREDAIRTIANRGTYFDEEDIDRFLSLSFPGVDELVGLIELMRLSRSRPLDVVVVDTAPTGHTLRLLEMPDTLLRLSQVLDDMHAKHRFLASSLGGTWRGDFADDAIAEIEREATALRQVLGDPARSSFTWVTLPEEMSVRESEDGVGEITALGVRVDVVVVNRVCPAPDRACPMCSPRADAEWRWRRHIADTFDDRTLLEVPARPTEPCGPAALLELAGSVRYLDARRPRAAPDRGAIEDAPTAVTFAQAASPIAATVRLAFYGGKGGVGKTTVAAASAIELAEARPNDRVLCLSTDPAHSLGDAIGVDLGGEVRKLPGGPRNLELRELDAAHAWEVERERYRRGIDDLFSSIFRGRMDASFDRAVLEDLLDLAPPGIDELLALVTLLDALLGSEEPSAAEAALAVKPVKRRKTRAKAAQPERYDLVVVDTAPTGHTLRLLALPEKALEWVHALMSIILKYRDIVGLGEFASDLTRFARRLRRLMELLCDPVRSAFVIVTRPAALPALETERLAKELRHLRVP